MSAPPEITRLVERFREFRDDYTHGSYNEAQLRQEFLDPLLRALGWDVDNEKGYAEAYKEVIHEDSIRVEESAKAPDYCLRIGGQRKFFLEAKKPSVNIKDSPHPAYQLRRYAWSAKLPVSILTDFEELAVYDCRAKPKPDDKASTARVKYFTFEEYDERWEEIADLFSPDAINRGSFDRFAESNKQKRGTAEVDAVFLEEIETWRELLAKNINSRNADLSDRELNYAVQITIDRIIFLRMCEGRGIEHYGQLQALLNGQGVYGRLKEIFQRADEKYNSGLFHFTGEKHREPPDELTLSLAIDDKPLKEIVKRLYYPESPYEFAVLPGEILGQVYEQFLGKVIVRSGRGVKVEPKPEVRKAGGVYYTPSYIVDYIVANTVGELLKDRTPKQAYKLRILDPACGSGSFLIVAYQKLLDWYLEQYSAEPAKHKKVIYERRPGQWRLTTAERKRILLGSIYGVDIDTQAVEVTKLSLLLKVLEGETQESLDRQFRLFHKERALPDLDNNIKCGNSLIGPDFYDDPQMSFLDDEERLRINVFDWQAEFAEVFQGTSGGFDAVIGNPPYVRQESLKATKSYFSKRYHAYESTADLYVYFIERALSLLNYKGLHSFIVSSSFLRSNYGGPLRGYAPSIAKLVEVVDFEGLPVFAAAKDTYVCIPRFRKGNGPAKTRVCKIKSLMNLDLPRMVQSQSYAIPRSQFGVSGWVLDDPKLVRLFKKIASRTTTLEAHTKGRIFRGIITGLNEAFEIDSVQYAQFLGRCPQSKEILHSFLGGQDVRRYVRRNGERYLIAIPAGWTRATMQSSGQSSVDLSERTAWRWFAQRYGPIAEHLAPFEARARVRQDSGEFWWELRSCDYYDVLDGAKIIYPDIAKSPRFYLDPGGTYIRNTAYCLDSNDKCLLAILNSRMTWFHIARVSIPFGTRAGEFRYRLFTQYMGQIPIPNCLQTEKHNLAVRKRIIQSVDQLVAFLARLDLIRTGHERNSLERQIAAVDRQIDQLVYELYGLTDAEIALVEAATAPASRAAVLSDDADTGE